MVDPRDTHCQFAKFNRNGRCIATCHYNVAYNYECDCTGLKRKPLNEEDRHEVKVNMGFIDGNTVEIDDKGYAKIKPAEKIRGEDGKADYQAYGWGTYIDDNGEVFSFESDVNGKKFRKYRTI